ncbi:hypothetical protein [Streptomyces sp. NPDC053542]|uniref:hypothetical protein n=1 Tax=Streptomyces sp. NPDC053542 TaxID=3365710 RepID=UPI0037D4677C
MKRSALRLAAVALPVTALVLTAGGTASAHDDGDDFLKSRIVVTKTYHACEGAGPHGTHSCGAWSYSASIETGRDGDLELYND